MRQTVTYFKWDLLKRLLYTEIHTITGAPETFNFVQSCSSSETSISTLFPSTVTDLTWGIEVSERAAFTAKETAS